MSIRLLPLFWVPLRSLVLWQPYGLFRGFGAAKFPILSLLSMGTCSHSPGLFHMAAYSCSLVALFLLACLPVGWFGFFWGCL